MQSKPVYFALGIAFVAVFTVYAFLSCLSLFGKGGYYGIINGCAVIVLWIAVCVVPVLFLTGKLNRFLGKFVFHKEYNDDVMQRPNRLKNVLPVFIIILAVSLMLLIYATVIAVKMTGADYIRCEGVLTEYGCGYFDLSGTLHYAESSSSWSGVYFENGSTIVIFYERLNPENAVYPADNVMMFVAGWFFLCGGAIALSSAFNRYASIIPIFAGLLFTVIAVCIQIGISLAGGLNFWGTVLSGATAYFMNVLLALGAYTLVFGLVKTFKREK